MSDQESEGLNICVFMYYGSDSSLGDGGLFEDAPLDNTPASARNSPLPPRPQRSSLRRAPTPVTYTSTDEEALAPLPIDDLLQLSGDDHIEHSAIGAVLLRRMERTVASFGLPPTEFMHMLKFCECLVSGSMVLATLFPGVFSPGDIDLYVSDTFKASVLGCLRRNGYTSVRSVFPWIQRGAPSTMPSFHPNAVAPASFGGFGPPSTVFPSAFPPQALQPALSNKGNADEILEIFEIHNDVGQKINVIVSVGQAILPLIRFHSTLVMNYISHHGVVVLHRLTLGRIGIKNLSPEGMSSRTKRCYAKYHKRGFHILGRAPDGHVCEKDGDCLQTPRSLFDEHVEHFKFPGYEDEPEHVLRLSEARILRWRSAAASSCKSSSVEECGFYLCNDQSRGTFFLYLNFSFLKLPSIMHFLTLIS
ncbi:hypothetical protein DFP72DRAFT_855075 [Ephemerocybe angulata]|uniref:Uncharacterized protein n=1 Tax=Ephemerocybe angulata TaxID=980116 RepID=A0A8H6LZY6_9AGAR|nr:hypothetical protein DFP72DRAFT_855075 [Tulosesus angulatus]